MPIQKIQFDLLIDDLAKQGYAICENFVPSETIYSLADVARNQQTNGHMSAAKIGHRNKALNQNIRGDSIFWIDENNAHTGVQAYFSQMHALRVAINKTLFMNLRELEAHFAIYPIGSAYKKHLDQFQAESQTIQARQLSSILYLNPDWQADDGGELRLYTSEHTHLDIAPTGGKLVLFLSSRFWHEVLPAKRERISLTGWYRNGSGLRL